MSKAKEPKSQINKISNEEAIPQALFSEIYNPDLLPEDKNLPLPGLINLKNLLNTSSSCITISVEIPSKIQNIDLYLFINNEKRDMFHQISAGLFHFNEVYLSKGKNIIQIFYKRRNKKSRPVQRIIIRK